MAEDDNYTILIVDDNDDVRLLVRKVLERQGHTILEATDGEGAIDVVEAVVPDLILMDLRMPGEMDGLETTSQLLEDPRLKRVPIVALTASVLEHDRQQAVDAGCIGFIGKPLDVNALPEMVSQYVKRGAQAR